MICEVTQQVARVFAGFERKVLRTPNTDEDVEKRGEQAFIRVLRVPDPELGAEIPALALEYDRAPPVGRLVVRNELKVEVPVAAHISSERLRAIVEPQRSSQREFILPRAEESVRAVLQKKVEAFAERSTHFG